MIEKLTPEQLKAVFDLSDTSDVTRADQKAATAVTCLSCAAGTIRLLKHYHPEIFVDPRLEAAKKLAREILAEEYEKVSDPRASEAARIGVHDGTVFDKAIIRALLMDIQVGEN